MGTYKIVEAMPYHGVQLHRVVNTETGEESMLGTYAECVEIATLAEAGELKGSFGINQKVS